LHIVIGYIFLSSQKNNQKKMKKLLFTLAISLATLTSCESDLVSAPPSDASSSTSNNDGILPTKVVIVDPNGATETIEYTYNGMTLIKEVSSDGSYYDYVYVDNKLTEINLTSPQNDNILESYTYDNEGRVATVSTNIIGTGVYDYSLSYNADSSVITEISTTIPGATASTTTISNGNMVGETGGGSANEVITYTHDTMNAPFKNINNIDILVTINSENSYNYQFNANNILTENTTSSMFSEVITNTYTYTDFNYPRTTVENEDGDITTYTYTYNND